MVHKVVEKGRLTKESDEITAFFNYKKNIGKTIPSDYFNTNGLEKKELQKAKEVNQNQNKLILEIFKKRRKLTPEECWKIVIETSPKTPITSVRRSITSLTDSGHLTKTSFKKVSCLGKPAHVWIITSAVPKEGINIYYCKGAKIKR